MVVSLESYVKDILDRIDRTQQSQSMQLSSINNLASKISIQIAQFRSENLKLRNKAGTEMETKRLNTLMLGACISRFVVDYVSELKKLKQVASVKEYYKSYIDILNRLQHPQEYSLKFQALLESDTHTIQLEDVGETENDKDVEKMVLEDVEEQEDSVARVVNESPQDSLVITGYLGKNKLERLCDTSSIQDVFVSSEGDKGSYDIQRDTIVPKNVSATSLVAQVMKKMDHSLLKPRLQKRRKYDEANFGRLHVSQVNCDNIKSKVGNFSRAIVAPLLVTIMKEDLLVSIIEHGNFVEVVVINDTKTWKFATDLIIAESFEWKQGWLSWLIKHWWRIIHDSDTYGTDGMTKRYVTNPQREFRTLYNTITDDMLKKGLLNVYNTFGTEVCLVGAKLDCEGQTYVADCYLKMVNFCYDADTRGVVKGVKTGLDEAMFYYNLGSVGDCFPQNVGVLFGLVKELLKLEKHLGASGIDIPFCAQVNDASQSVERKSNVFSLLNYDEDLKEMENQNSISCLANGIKEKKTFPLEIYKYYMEVQFSGKFGACSQVNYADIFRSQPKLKVDIISKLVTTYFNEEMVIKNRSQAVDKWLVKWKWKKLHRRKMDMLKIGINSLDPWGQGSLDPWGQGSFKRGVLLCVCFEFRVIYVVLLSRRLDPFPFNYNMGIDIVNYVNDFHGSPHIPRDCNSSFITLVPKVDDPITIGDFRPISLTGCQYKIIAKVLANRLATVIPLVIGEVQMAFLKGRQITDGPLLVNKIVSWAKKRKKKLLLFKLDFEKAFDSLSWSFLDSIMDQIGTYYFSSFKVPTTIINKLESICRNFFWARNSDERKMAWIAWDKVIALLDQGGLNIGGLKKDDLLSYGITLPSLFKRKTGNGLTTKFWLDSWIGGPPICNSFPRLFRLERNTNCLVHDRVPQPAANRPLSAASVPAAEHQELQELCSLISKLCLSNDQYIWKCTISDDRRFTVKSMRTYINILLHPLEPQPFKWNKILPIKINISSWRIFHKRLPTRCNLDRRGIDLNSTRCPACGEDIETEEHLFNSCRIAKHTWSKVLIWWKINNVSISSLSDAINLAERVSIPGNLKAYFDVVVQTTLWFLWRFRNEMCFSLKQPSKDLILNEIKLSSFNWISCMSRKACINWITWFDNPCNALCN
ncbi:RNA-directed DNA polymerase, eukaryota [Tanacetum coccineum]